MANKSYHSHSAEEEQGKVFMCGFFALLESQPRKKTETKHCIEGNRSIVF